MNKFSVEISVAVFRKGENACMSGMELAVPDGVILLAS